MSSDSNPFDDLLKAIDGADENTQPEISQILNLDAIVDGLQGVDNRKYPRIALAQKVLIHDHFSQKILKAQTMNISAHGVCLFTDAFKLNAGAAYKLEVHQFQEGPNLIFEGKLLRIINDKDANYVVLGFYVPNMPSPIVKAIEALS